MLEVRFERIPQGVSEKKVLGPTMKMVEFALENAGFREGTWVLKSPHRTRKKGAERFRAMRIEGQGIRIRCKPAGNDTCYEWIILPPVGTDSDAIFSDLCTLHPSSMRSNKSALVREKEIAIVAGLLGRMSDPEPRLIPNQNLEPRQEEVAQNPTEKNQNEENKVKSVAAAVSRKIATIDSLDVSGVDEILSSDFATDRALVAFGIHVGSLDFANKSALSPKIIKMLNIEGLTKKSPLYGSVQGAMRSIMMSLCNKGYIERLGGEKSTSGYRLLNNGKKRLKFLKGLLSKSILDELDNSISKSQQAIGSEGSSATQKKSVDDSIKTLKELIREHENVRQQMSDLKELMKELDKESEDEIFMGAGIEKTLKEKIEERSAIDEEIKKLRVRLEDIKKIEEKKNADMKILEEEMEKLILRKEEIESRLTVKC